MKHAKHTPGPWTYNRGTEIKGCDDAIRVANVNHALGNDKTVLANAQLIAAAPELLAALQIIATPLKNAGQDLTREQLINLLFDYRLEAAKAVAKATNGEGA